MDILFFLIPLSIVMLGLAVAAFIWAVRNEQFEDLEGPAWKILFDDNPPDTRGNTSHNTPGNISATTDSNPADNHSNSTAGDSKPFDDSTSSAMLSDKAPHRTTPNE